MSTLNITGEDGVLEKAGLVTRLRLLRLYFKAQKVVDLLADVQGYQIFHAAYFNGDPHPGNIMKLNDGNLL